MIDHNTIRFGDTLGSNPTLNASWWIMGGALPSNMVVTNNMFGWQLYGDGLVGPEAVLPGTVFLNNIVLNVEPWRQTAWTQKYPGVSFADNGTIGADVNGLLAGEAKIKAGTN